MITWRKPTPTHTERSNLGPSHCEATAVTTAPPCHPCRMLYQQRHIKSGIFFMALDTYSYIF